MLSAVQELEYIPNASARGLAGRRTGVLGLLIPGHDIPATSHGRTDTATTVEFLDDHDNSHAGFLRNRYFEQLVQGAEAAAWRDGYALLIAAGTSVSRDVMLRDLTGRVDGTVVVSRTVPDELIERAAHSVRWSWYSDLPGTTDSVRVDNRGGMSALARYILRVKPPGPVIYLAGPPNSPDAAARELGFRDAIAAHPDRWHSALAEFTFQGGHGAIVDQLRTEAPGAVIGANDQSALGALAALQEAGILVPEDCVVTGFDGIDEARYGPSGSDHCAPADDRSGSPRRCRRPAAANRPPGRRTARPPAARGRAAAGQQREAEAGLSAGTGRRRPVHPKNASLGLQNIM